MEQYFFTYTNHNIDLIVFSDRKQERGCLHIPVDHKPWPFSTLMRFEFFAKSREVLSQYDYLYYCDVDMKFVSCVGDAIIGDLVATQHPYFYNVDRAKFSYEANPSSAAYVPANLGSHYFAGGFFGGTSKAFISMSHILQERIDRDLKKGYIAKWHDESHLNWYFAHNPPQRILDPGYCYPERANLPFAAHLLALEKDHAAVRKTTGRKEAVDLSRPKEFVRQAHWDSVNRGFKLKQAENSDSVRTWISHWLSWLGIKKGRSCIEIGCYPGRYLPMVSASGYVLNGIDMTPEVTSLLPAWLRGEGCTIGEFVHADFRLHDFNQTYDLVYSVGFLEHFEDWESVLRKHASLVSPGGYLMISVPNFKGALQRWPRWYLDKENFYRHNLRAMRIREWAKVLRSLNMKVEWCGYFGRYDFWVDRMSRTRAQSLLLQFIARHKKSIAAKVGNHALWSPFCGIVARK